MIADAPLPAATPRVAILAHVFYRNIWPELKDCIHNFISVCGADNVKVVITSPDGEPAAFLQSEMPFASVIPVPDRGYDVGPFFEALASIDLSAFDFVVKLHTKRNMDRFWMNYRPYKGDEWRRSLLSFCSSEKAVATSLRGFARDPTLGMVAGRGVTDPSGVASGRYDFTEAYALMRRFGLTPSGTTLVFGTMFMVRAKILEPVAGKLRIGDFDFVNEKTVHKVYGNAGLWEFAFALLTTSQGYRVARGRFPAMLSRFWNRWRVFVYRTIRFLSDKRRAILSGPVRPD